MRHFHTFHTKDEPDGIPPTVNEGNFCNESLIVLLVYFHGTRHSHWHKVKSHYNFDFHSLISEMNIFICLLAICFFYRNFYSSPLPILLHSMLLNFVTAISIYLSILDINTLSDVCCTNILSHSASLFIFTAVSFIEYFWFDIISLLFVLCFYFL